MSWIRVPLFFGTLKVKPRRHLRREEATGQIPVLRLGSTYITWRPRNFRRVTAPANEVDIPSPHSNARISNHAGPSQGLPVEKVSRASQKPPVLTGFAPVQRPCSSEGLRPCRSGQLKKPPRPCRGRQLEKASAPCRNRRFKRLLSARPRIMRRRNKRLRTARLRLRSQPIARTHPAPPAVTLVGQGERGTARLLPERSAEFREARAAPSEARSASAGSRGYGGRPAAPPKRRLRPRRSRRRCRRSARSRRPPRPISAPASRHRSGASASAMFFVTGPVTRSTSAWRGEATKCSPKRSRS